MLLYTPSTARTRFPFYWSRRKRWDHWRYTRWAQSEFWDSHRACGQRLGASEQRTFPRLSSKLAFRRMPQGKLPWKGQNTHITYSMETKVSVHKYSTLLPYRSKTDCDMAWIALPMKRFSRILSETCFLTRNPTWYPYKALRLPNSEGLPHTMFFLAHEIPGDERKLLRGEVLAIVAAIKMRLSLPRLSSHPIIPVRTVIPQYSYGDPLWVIQRPSWLTGFSRSLFFLSRPISMDGYSKLFSTVRRLIFGWLRSSTFELRKQPNQTSRSSCSIWQVDQLELPPRRCRCQWNNLTGFRLRDDGGICCLISQGAIFD